jgi:uncharacterized repeat protein (TIGR01451 family)
MSKNCTAYPCNLLPDTQCCAQCRAQCCAQHLALQWLGVLFALFAFVALVVMPASALAQTTFNYTGALQTYTVPAGAVGVLIVAKGAGGGGGGADGGTGLGGKGGAGASATGTYLTAPGTVLNVAVGGGGQAGIYCTTATGGLALGGVAAGGFAGGAGGRAGGVGCSGNGGGGGAASGVLNLLLAGGGGGGQGGSLNGLGRFGDDSTATGALPGVAGAVGVDRGATFDGGGGGGGGAGCPAGAGGPMHPEGTLGVQGGFAGSSCKDPAVTGFTVTGAGGAVGGADRVAGTAGSVTITPLFPNLVVSKTAPSPALVVGANSTYSLTVTNSAPYAATSARVLDQLPANLTFVSYSGAGWTCTPAPGGTGVLITCNYVGTIAASGGTSSVLAIVVKPVLAAANTSVTNYASTDPTSANSPPTPGAACAPATSCAAAGPSPVTAPTVTLRKTWVSAAVSDAVNVTATGLTTLASIANTANETDAGLPQLVAAGSSIALAETFTTGSAANYASSLACSGSSGFSGNILTVGSTDTAIVCTFTNKSIAVALTITKTDAKTLATSGGTNAYVLTVSNAGPGAADGVIVTDTAGAGLTCPAGNPVTCTVTGVGAVCPAGALTFASLSAGVAIPTLPNAGALQFSYACNVN